MLRKTIFRKIHARGLEMIAIIFEVWPKPNHRQDYLDIAATLRPLLETIDGFISVERFESLTEPKKMLSLSFFRDEAAVQAWRNLTAHRAAQAKGRAEVFANYRLRVADVVRDYGIHERQQAPRDSLVAHNHSPSG
jgi:heme-degrading monooxygenase HmoA